MAVHARFMHVENDIGKMKDGWGVISKTFA